MNWLRRLLCRHEDVTSIEKSEWYGDLIQCGETETWTRDIEVTRCRKCGRTASRRAAGPVRYEGWT